MKSYTSVSCIVSIGTTMIRAIIKYENQFSQGKKHLDIKAAAFDIENR